MYYTNEILQGVSHIDVVNPQVHGLPI